MPQLQAASKYAKKSTDANEKPDSNGKHTVIEMKPLKDTNKNLSASTDEFFKTFETVIEDIDKIQTNNSEIRKLQVKVLGAVNQEQVEKDRATLDDKVAENKKFGVRIRNALKKEQDRLDDKALAASNNDGQQKSARENHEMRLRRTQIAAHSRRFYDLWTEYNNQQLEYKDRSKDLLKRRCKIVNENLTDEEIETMLEEGKTQMFNASILDDTTKAREQLNELKDRHDEFLKLEKSIREVYDLFMELAALVEQQGESLNNIERLITDAQDRVVKGKEELVKAHEHKKSSRKKMIILAAILLAIIIIVIIVAASGSSSGSSSQS